MVKMGCKEDENHVTFLSACPTALPFAPSSILCSHTGNVLTGPGWTDSPTPKKSGQVNTAGPKPVHGANMGSMQARNTSSSVRGAITWFRSQRMSVRQRAQERGAREAIQDNE